MGPDQNPYGIHQADQKKMKSYEIKIYLRNFETTISQILLSIKYKKCCKISPSFAPSENFFFIMHHPVLMLLIK
jgi:hypothetical protein